MKTKKPTKNYLKNLQKKYAKKGKGLPFVGFAPDPQKNATAFNELSGETNPSEPSIVNASADGGNISVAVSGGGMGEAVSQKDLYLYYGDAYITEDGNEYVKHLKEMEVWAVSEKQAINLLKERIRRKFRYDRWDTIELDLSCLENVSEQERLERDRTELGYKESEKELIDYENRMNGDYNFYDPDREDDYMVGDTLIQGSMSVHEALYALDEINKGENK